VTTATEDLDGQCIHELTRRFCSLCNGAEDLGRKEHALEVERVLALPGWREARYGGKCAKCRTHYDPGCAIRKKNGLDRCPEQSPNWIAMCCAPAEEDEGPEEEW
jgi:hypothetical protein